MSDFASAAVRASAPYVAAALGGVFAERVGVPNIALEGMMLASAFGAVAVGVAGGGAALGIACAIGVGAALAAVHVFAVERLRIDAIVSGLSLNLAASAGTRILLRNFYHSSSNSPSLAGSADRIVLLLLAVAFVASIGAQRFYANAPLGLRMRAAGLRPDALVSSGVRVFGVRVRGLVLSGAFAGLAGAALGLEGRQFQSDMTAGRGFVALACVLATREHPVGACVMAFGFGLLEALSIRAGGAFLGLVHALPYVATLLVLGTIGLLRPGSRLGRNPGAG